MPETVTSQRRQGAAPEAWTCASTQSASAATLSERELRLIDAWWRAANYLSVGQIYLMGNPLLREPLLPEHVKPRLLGHWGPLRA
jgi:xylulose-5-phosphate/fructose-6-phosphate phosphoketolase